MIYRNFARKETQPQRTAHRGILFSSNNYGDPFFNQINFSSPNIKQSQKLYIFHSFLFTYKRCFYDYDSTMT